MRDGLVVPASSALPGRPLPGERTLLERTWTAGEAVTLGSTSAVAPQQASCVELFRVDLGDVSGHISRGGAPPDTQLAFSPDGSLLAVGSFRGDVLVIDAWTGAVRARRTLAETMVKQVAWSPDGATLYAAEQSPDAYLHALDPATLASRWTLRLADHVETSPPPPGDDVYGVYTLPSAYGLVVRPDGHLLIAGVHAWNTAEGRKNASRLLHLDPSGAVVAAWPKKGALDATLMHPAMAENTGTVGVFVGRSAAGEAPSDAAIGGVQLLSWPQLSPVGAVRPRPLAPYYDKVFPWQGLGLTKDADKVMLGLTDGRVWLQDVAGGRPITLEPGTPVEAGAVPIVASVGSAELVGDTVIAATSETHIPWGAAAPEVKPPSAHPRERTLFAWALDGTLRWTWSGKWAPQGVTVSPDASTLVVGAGLRGDDRRDLYGALVFDLAGDGTGAQRLQTVCSTELPVFFSMAATDDERIAVVEHPVSREGAAVGAYRVTVLR